MTIDDGGPAFPVGSDLGPASNIVDGGYGGMTLRDYFAAHALVGMLSYSMLNPNTGNYHENCNIDDAAHVAYEFADAMLEARKESR